MFLQFYRLHHIMLFCTCFARVCTDVNILTGTAFSLNRYSRQQLFSL